MIARNKARKALAAIVERMGRSEVDDLLGNWNGHELSEDCTKIVLEGERDFTASQFFKWLFGDEALAPVFSLYNKGWEERVNTARKIAASV